METLQRLFADGLNWQSGLNLITAWVLTSGLRIVLILALAWLILRAVRLGLSRFQARVTEHSGPTGVEHVKRTKTLSDMLQNIANLAIVAIAGLTVLQELRVNILPVLTGAGILGLAVGFGAQTLVKDFISGFFLILENQVRVGDVVQINGTGGLVEEINLRTIVLRDVNGTVHILPCGTVTMLSNLSMDFAYAVLDVGVAYRHDTDEVVKLLVTIANEMQQTNDFGELILEPLDVLGVEAFGDNSVTIRVRMKTQPLAQFAVTREYRRRVKKAFDAAGIEIPFPQRSITVRHLSPPEQAGPSEPPQ